MDDFYINSTSQDEGYNLINIIYDSDYEEFQRKIEFIEYVVTCVIICIGLPLNLGAIFAFSSHVRNGDVALIYVINLLISDLIQLCCMIILVARHEDWMTFVTGYFIYYYGVAASVGFMVCIALERYLVVACPLWYHFRRTIKISVLVCVVLWAFPPVFLLTFYFWVDSRVVDILFGVFLLLPLPPLLFFLGGTIKALSASTVPSDEKRRILGILVLVLLIYMLMFLPQIICFLAGEMCNFTFSILSRMLIRFSPLADLLLWALVSRARRSVDFAEARHANGVCSGIFRKFCSPAHPAQILRFPTFVPPTGASGKEGGEKAWVF